MIHWHEVSSNAGGATPPVPTPGEDFAAGRGCGRSMGNLQEESALLTTTRNITLSRKRNFATDSPLVWFPAAVRVCIDGAAVVASTRRTYVHIFTMLRYATKPLRLLLLPRLAGLSGLALMTASCASAAVLRCMCIVCGMPAVAAVGHGAATAVAVRGAADRTTRT